jgi:hypothetical protein
MLEKKEIIYGEHITVAKLKEKISTFLKEDFNYPAADELVNHTIQFLSLELDFFECGIDAKILENPDTKVFYNKEDFSFFIKNKGLCSSRPTEFNPLINCYQRKFYFETSDVMGFDEVRVYDTSLHKIFNYQEAQNYLNRLFAPAVKDFELCIWSAYQLLIPYKKYQQSVSLYEKSSINVWSEDSLNPLSEILLCEYLEEDLSKFAPPYRIMNGNELLENLQKIKSDLTSEQVYDLIFCKKQSNYDKLLFPVNINGCQVSQVANVPLNKIYISDAFYEHIVNEVFGDRVNGNEEHHKILQDKAAPQIYYNAKESEIINSERTALNKFIAEMVIKEFRQSSVITANDVWRNIKASKYDIIQSIGDNTLTWILPVSSNNKISKEVQKVTVYKTVNKVIRNLKAS